MGGYLREGLGAAGVTADLITDSGATGRELTRAEVPADARTILGIAALAPIAASGSASDLTSGKVPAARLPTISFKTFAHSGRVGAGSISVPGTLVGDIIVTENHYAGGGGDGSFAPDWEPVVTVADQIQQTTATNTAGLPLFTTVMRQS